LSKLIRNEQEYYVHALIDPELADFNEIIHPELNHLLNEARDEANHIRDEARDKAKKLAERLTAEEKQVIDPGSLWLRIEDMSKTKSYFNYLDIIHCGSSILNLWPRYVGDRRTRLLKALNKLRPRIESCLVLVDNFPQGSLTAKVSKRLNIIQRKMDNNWEISRGNDPQRLTDALVTANVVSNELKQVELEIRKLHSIQQMLVFISKFFKKSFIFQSINLIIAFFLLPILVYYLNFFLPEIMITSQNIWEYQKLAMILGGFSGLCLALMIATKNIP